MGKPAAILGSFHLCPKKTGKIPHVGGPVVVGSPNVTIGGIPAARQGDKLICIGPPDSISAGSSSVTINGKQPRESAIQRLMVAKFYLVCLRF